MGGAGSQGFGNGAAARADFDYGATGQVTDRGRDALAGVGIDKEVLSELRFDGHGLH
jgi:hypothetical protein